MVPGTVFLFVFLCLQPPRFTHSCEFKKLHETTIRFVALKTNFGGTQDSKSRSFTLGHKLGNGGYGSVIAAKMEAEGSEPALRATFKFVPGAQDKEALKALKLEQKIFDQLQNKEPGFLAYIGGGYINLELFGNRFVIVTEMFETDLWEFALGKSIKNELERKIFAVEFLIKSITIVRSLHERGMVHRDIKPDNFLIRKNPDGTIDLALIDFGLVQLPDDQPDDPFFAYLFSSKANHRNNKRKRLSNPKDDLEGLLYTFCFLVDAKKWKAQDEPQALARKESFSEYLAKIFESDPILLGALNCMVTDESYKNWNSGKNAKNSFKFEDHLAKLKSALNELAARRPKSSSVYYKLGSLRPNQPTLKPIAV